MKNHLLRHSPVPHLLLAFGLILVMFTGCKKDASSPAPVVAASGTAIARINANPITFASPNTGNMATKRLDNPTTPWMAYITKADSIKIYGGTMFDGKPCEIYMGLRLTTARLGTYSLNYNFSSGNKAKKFVGYFWPVEEAASWFRPPLFDANNFVFSGSVTLTKVDLVNKKISGTFQMNQDFSASGRYFVADGQFTDLSGWN